jgi:hypothetical protein
MSGGKKRRAATTSKAVKRSKTQATEKTIDDPISNTAPQVRLSSISKIHRDRFTISWVYITCDHFVVYFDEKPK